LCYGDISTATLDLEGQGAAFRPDIPVHGSHAVIAMQAQLEEKGKPFDRWIP
jgi:hypothetical protein